MRRFPRNWRAAAITKTLRCKNSVRSRMMTPAGALLSAFKRMPTNNPSLEMTGREALEPYCPNTAAQAELKLAFCRRRHAVIARAFGISPAQSR